MTKRENKSPSRSTKRALTSSVLALVLCFVMLLGTTFAWFTDTASTKVNTIQAGNLKVDLEKYVGKDDGGNDVWESAEGKVLEFIKAEDHENEDILWEPGATYELPAVRVVNKGNLALKYKVVVSAINGSSDLAKVLDVYMLEGEKDTSKSAPYGTKVGTLESVLAPKFASNEKILEPNGTTKALTISLHMQETAGNEYQGLSIESIAVTVYAAQAAVEFDSTTNQYDQTAEYSDTVWDGKTVAEPKTDDKGVYHITSAAEFYWLVCGDNGIPAGSTVVLDADIDLNGATIKGYNNGVFDSNFDGKGHTVSNFTVATETGKGYYCGLFPYLYDGCSVKNLTVKNATSIANVSMVGAIVGGAYGRSTIENCHAINCTVIGAKKVGSVVGYIATNTTDKCSAADCVVYCANSDENQSGEVVGYQDNCTATNISSTNVTVKRGVTAVSSAAELATALDNSGNAPSYARNIVLTADIDGSNWTAIAAGSNYPAVSIDGNGHTIKNLSSCLFDSLPARDFVFKNINFTNVNISSANNRGLGVIVGEGQANGGGSYTITNCHINGGTIDGGSSYYVGGFIGFKSDGCNVTFTNCSVTNLTLKTSEESVGAFAGHLYDTTTLTNCSVKGNTSVTNTANRNGSDAKAGAFVGTVYTVNATGCSVDSTVTVSNYNAKDPINDGLFGRNAGGTITVN